MKVFIICYASLFLASPLLSMLVVWMFLRPEKSRLYGELWERNQKEKKKESKKEEKHAVILKLPNRILQKLKGKTLLRWYVKVIYIDVNKLLRASSQNKFSKSSHSIWTQCAQLFIRTFDLHTHVEEHLLKLLAQRSK